VTRKMTRKVNNTFLVITFYIVKHFRIFFHRKLRYILTNYRISYKYPILLISPMNILFYLIILSYTRLIPL